MNWVRQSVQLSYISQEKGQMNSDFLSFSLTHTNKRDEIYLRPAAAQLETLNTTSRVNKHSTKSIVIHVTRFSKSAKVFN